MQRTARLVAMCASVALIAAACSAGSRRSGSGPGSTADTQRPHNLAGAALTKSRRADAPTYHYFFTHINMGGSWPNEICGGYLNGSRTCDAWSTTQSGQTAPFSNRKVRVGWEDQAQGHKFRIDVVDGQGFLQGSIPDRSSNRFTVTAGGASVWNVKGTVTTGTDTTKVGQKGGPLAIDVHAPKFSDWSYDFYIAGWLLYEVNRGPTVATVSSAPNPTTKGQAVRFTALVRTAGSGSAAITGSVQFQVDGQPKGTAVPVTGGLTAISAPFIDLDVGTHYVTAVYSGDDNWSGSTSRPSGHEVDPKP
jgi:Bacterial Ig-like domain (group 3)